MISKQGLEQFINLYEEKYSVRLAEQEASDMFLKLVNIVQLGNKNLKNN